jgi:hypothetical protein
MAVPGLDPGISPDDPDSVKRSAFRIGITGTRPVMTKEAMYGMSELIQKAQVTLLHPCEEAKAHVEREET